MLSVNQGDGTLLNGIAREIFYYQVVLVTVVAKERKSKCNHAEAAGLTSST